MINFFFIVVHIIGIFLGLWILLFSIPLHIIISIMRKNKRKLEQQTDLLKEQNDLLKEKLNNEEKSKTKKEKKV